MPENTLPSLFDSAPCSLLRIAPDGTILNGNMQAFSVLGFQDEESLLQANARLLSPGREAWWRPYDRHETSYCTNTLITLSVKDGTSVLFRANCHYHIENNVLIATDVALVPGKDFQDTLNINNVLLRIAGALRHADNLAAFYREIHTILRECVDAENFVVALLDPEEDALFFPYLADDHDESLQIIPNFSDPNTSSPTVEVIRSGKPLYLSHYSLKHQMEKGEYKHCIGSIPACWLGVPLIAQRKTVGAMVMQHYTDGMRYTRKDVDLLVAVSEQVALVIDRMQAIKHMEESEKLHKHIFDNMAEGIFRLDSNGEVLIANNALVQIMGYDSPYQFLGQVDPYNCFVDPTVIQDYLLPTLFAEGIVKNFETQLIRKNGEIFWASINYRLERNEKGDAAYILGGVTDITLRKQAEEKLSKAHDAVKREVQEQTRQLREANTRLEELSALKSQFLSSASHELRTPMTSILGFLALNRNMFNKHFMPLIDQNPELRSKAERIIKNIEIVRKEGDRLTRLINDILDLSKIESGQFAWKDRTDSATRFFRQSLDVAIEQLSLNNDVTLRVSIPDNLPEITIDPDKLHQVVLNLLNNAAKFTLEGYIQVAAACDEVQISFSVEDTGVGIAEQEQKHVFDMFRQSSNDTLPSDIPKGTGLGLPICAQIVDHYEGDLRLASAPGKGSTFTMILPVATSSN